MKIQTKTVLIVLPLIITPLLFTAFIAFLSARNGITEITTEYLKYKLDELEKYAESQWNLLVTNELEDNEEYIKIAKSAIESFAKSIIRKETELIFAVDENMNIDMSSGDITLLDNEMEQVAKIMKSKSEGWQQLFLGGTNRVSQVSFFKPFNWYIFVTEHQETFYRSVNQIFWQTGIILVIAVTVSIVLLILFSFFLTKPVNRLVSAMENIISTDNLSKRVDVLFSDEIGKLGHTFNLMTSQLEKAYEQIKRYALKAVVAQNREAMIRNIFQKYVPNSIINEFFVHPESMLKSEERELAILVSDIRGFNTISENISTEDTVDSLNKYFEIMVDIIMNHNGIVDKYIGDTIMAFYGTPVKRNDDAYQAVLSGLRMLKALDNFNKGQIKQNRPEFKIGIGVSYGKVIVGNIGSEKKMEYTVIGDIVNLTSKLEELTKQYQEPFIISENVFKQVYKDIPCRMMDHINVDGKNKSIRIYAPHEALNKKEKLGWKYHKEGLIHYYKKEFEQALECFQKVQEILLDDKCSLIFQERCDFYINNPPPENWDGVISL